MNDNILLTIELVPSTSWYNNVRSNVDKNTWNRIRKKIYKLSNYSCEICGGKGNKWPLECHEVFEYIYDKHIQKLIRLIALCHKCHNVKHIGHSIVKGKYNESVKHLANINNWSIKKAENYIDNSFEIWKERSNHKWELDLSLLNNFINNNEI